MLKNLKDEAGGVIRVEAVHPHWRGQLLLRSAAGSVVHEGVGHAGEYVLENGLLRVKWADYPAETFRRLGDIYVHTDLLDGAPELPSLSCVRFRSDVFAISEVAINLPDEDAVVHLRAGSSDIDVFRQVLVDREYESPHMPSYATTVVDLGANIGLSAIFFANKYPGATIFAVEPDGSNFDLLARNVSALGSRIECLNAAIWIHDGAIALESEDEQQRPLEAWGVRVATHPAAPGQGVASIRMDTALQGWNLTSVDLLKVDIEGAELELFADPDLGWLDLVKFVAVETHDRFRPGSEAAVRRALGASYVELPRSGENLLFKRRE
ncbi:MAG: hypothetical protein JWQ46_434 [Phenylobacterium sp.]|nr:hypothetical protein [Phenylobacterium sp.]MDB5465672.1 hypothetical protein [Phenylobacterium sp.]